MRAEKRLIRITRASEGQYVYLHSVLVLGTKKKWQFLWPCQKQRHKDYSLVNPFANRQTVSVFPGRFLSSGLAADFDGVHIFSLSNVNQCQGGCNLKKENRNTRYLLVRC